MNTSYNPYVPIPLPVNGTSFIAPYWADVDLRGIGQVYYRQTTSPVLLARASNEIQTAFINHQNVNITNIFIVTWYTVGYYPKVINRVRLIYIVMYMKVIINSNYII